MTTDKRAPVFYLDEPTALWLRAGENAVLALDFKRDVTALSFLVRYSEYRWAYAPVAYDVLEPGTLSTIDDSQAADGLITIEIDINTVNLWKDRRINLELFATEDGRTWVAASRTVHVAIGD